MNFDDIKKKAAETATKVASSKAARDLLANESFQKAVGTAFTAGMKLRDEVEKASVAAEKLLAPGEVSDDTVDLKRQLDELRER